MIEHDCLTANHYPTMRYICQILEDLTSYLENWYIVLYSKSTTTINLLFIKHYALKLTADIVNQ